MKRLLFLLLFALPAYGQVPVSLSPEPKLQFFSNNGVPLANGCVFTYAAGTSTPQATYVDSTGLTANTNPIILDAGGRANIWLTSQGYKLVLFSAGGVSCATGTQIWSVDGITGQLGLLSLANTWSGVQTFTQPIKITPSVNQLVLGTSPNTTTINAPAPSGAITVTLPILTGTLATLAGSTLTTATLTAPTINGLTVGGVVATGNPTNFANFTNGAAGTTLNQLAKLVPVGAGGTAVNTAITDTGGVIGVVIAGAGTTGLNVVQYLGQVLCVFDGSTTVEDYVQISSTTVGNCHDTGVTSYPTSGGQVIGRVLTTNVGAGTYLIDLFPPEIRAGTVGASIGCTNFTPVTVTNNNAQQNLMSCTIPANTLSQGSRLVVDMQGIESDASGAQTSSITISLGGGTACALSMATAIAGSQPWNATATLFLLTGGAGGTANWSCEYFSTASGGGVVGPFGVIGVPTIAVNTTISNVIQVTVQMGIANAGNSVTEQGLKAVVF